MFSSALLNTIYMPKNILFLTDKLPRSNYEGSLSPSEMKKNSLDRYSIQLPQLNDKKAAYNIMPSKEKYKKKNIEATHDAHYGSRVSERESNDWQNSALSSHTDEVLALTFYRLLCRGSTLLSAFLPSPPSGPTSFTNTRRPRASATRRSALWTAPSSENTTSTAIST